VTLRDFIIELFMNSSRLAVARRIMQHYFNPWFKALENSKKPGQLTARQVIDPLSGDQGKLATLEKTLTDSINRDVTGLQRLVSTGRAKEERAALCADSLIIELGKLGYFDYLKDQLSTVYNRVSQGNP
jgi:hypothetical protein